MVHGVDKESLPPCRLHWDQTSLKPQSLTGLYAFLKTSSASRIGGGIMVRSIIHESWGDETTFVQMSHCIKCHILICHYKIRHVFIELQSYREADKANAINYRSGSANRIESQKLTVRSSRNTKEFSTFGVLVNKFNQIGPDGIWSSEGQLNKHTWKRLLWLTDKVIPHSLCSSTLASLTFDFSSSSKIAFLGLAGGGGRSLSSGSVGSCFTMPGKENGFPST